MLCAPDTGAVTLLDFSEAADRRARCLNNRAGTLEYMVRMEEEEKGEGGKGRMGWMHCRNEK